MKRKVNGYLAIASILAVGAAAIFTILSASNANRVGAKPDGTNEASYDELKDSILYPEQ